MARLNMDWTALSSRMALRMAALFGLCTALPLLLLALLLARGAASAGDQRLEERLGALARANADQLAGRLAAADAVARTLTLRDVGELGAAIRPAALAHGVFASVDVVGRDGLLTSGGVALRPGPPQLTALEKGRTGLLAVATGDRASRVFLARAASASGSRRVVYFEVAPEWLWSGFDAATQASSLAVVDTSGRLLRGAPRAMTQGSLLGRLLAADPSRGADVQPVAWQATGVAWQGTLARIAPTGRALAGEGWGVVAFDRDPGFLAASAQVWSALLLALVLSLPAVLYVAARLASRYLPAIEGLRDAMPRLASRTFPRVAAPADDEPAEMVREFNQHVGRLHNRIEALETLAEIDRMLLQSADLEQVLGAILARVQQVTRCHGVAITLVDADSPDLGRVYHVAEGREDLPVERIALDHDMAAVLGQVRDGLTVARCEDSRHSFLVPIRNLGAEVFWVWPVTAGERLRAILAVGHREMPVTGTHVVQYGSEFASRLGIALSKTDREEELYRQAHFDPLTGLPNRLLFRDRLAQEVASATAGLGRGALLYIDLDHFKKVNDTLGHAAGDQLLSIVSQRLRSCVKDGDTVSRLGGDEFTVILRGVTEPDAVQGVATRIIDSLRLPVHLAGRDHFVGASIGATLFPDDGTAIEDLMRNADSAMYRAKSLGRGCVAFFDAAMAERAAPPTDTSLHRALRRREFSLYYQPQFSVATGELGGVEALLRWQTPRDGMRNPGDFVPAAEESGFIVDIGGWVLEAACSQLARWRESSVAPPRLSLNVSAQQLRHPEFPRLVKRSLEKYGLPASLLELELTETVLADELTGPALGQLAKLGVTLALDDFGTGYSSLSYLRQYPISVVKIDRSFLEDVPDDPAATTLVETIIVMAHTLGKKVVAEGIETMEQLDFLRERRCDLVQGFYLARPMSAAAVTELLEGRSMRGVATEVRAAG